MVPRRRVSTSGGRGLEVDLEGDAGLLGAHVARERVADEPDHEDTARVPSVNTSKRTRDTPQMSWTL